MVVIELKIWYNLTIITYILLGMLIYILLFCQINKIRKLRFIIFYQIYEMPMSTTYMPTYMLPLLDGLVGPIIRQQPHSVLTAQQQINDW